MGSTGLDIVAQAEAILASAKNFKGDRSERYALMKQIDLLHLGPYPIFQILVIPYYVFGSKPR
jgi:hypothetical protein